MKKYAFLLACLLPFFSCATVYKIEYALLQPSPSDDLSFKDDLIDIQFAFAETYVGFALQNKTDSGIKIHWNDLSIVFPSGKTSRIFHNGVKFINRKKPQAATVVPSNTKVSDILIPVEDVYSYSVRWLEVGGRSFFGGENKLVWDEKEISIYFPLEIKGAKKEYDFKFKINVSQPPPAPGQIK